MSYPASYHPAVVADPDSAAVDPVYPDLPSYPRSDPDFDLHSADSVDPATIFVPKPNYNVSHHLSGSGAKIVCKLRHFWHTLCSACQYFRHYDKFPPSELCLRAFQSSSPPVRLSAGTARLLQGISSVYTGHSPGYKSPRMNAGSPPSFSGRRFLPR